MKENYTQLYPNEQVAIKVGDYAFEHSTTLPKHIAEHHAWGVANHEMANYMISPLQAQFQIWLAKAIKAKRVLEIGTFIGFSALGWREAVGPDGHVTALEFSEEYAQVARNKFKELGITNIDVVVGDARETLAALPTSPDFKGPYDLVFIDADKSSYPTYLSLALSLSPPANSSSAPPYPRLLAPGATILADNILRRGLVADSSPANPYSSSLVIPADSKERKEDTRAWRQGADLKAIDEFNTALAKSERLDTFLIPLFDGLGAATLRD